MPEVKYLPTMPSLLLNRKEPFIHRDLSWLQFNERVLQESLPGTNPLLERMKFLSITSTNLDEFFMIRVASLESRCRKLYKEELMGAYQTHSRVRSSIYETVSKFTAKQSESLDFLIDELSQKGIFICRKADHRDLAKNIFMEEILPKLSNPQRMTSLEIRSLKNLQMALILSRGRWIPISNKLPATYMHYDEHRKSTYVFFLDEILVEHATEYFESSEDGGVIRLTRDGDFSIDIDEEERESVPDIIRKSLASRDRGRAVRLQYSGYLSQKLLDQVLAAFRLKADQLFPVIVPISLNGLWSAARFVRSVLGDSAGSISAPPLQSVIPNDLVNPAEIFGHLDKGDIILHHPYDSFESIERFIQAACEDRSVVSIEQTLYRVDPQSKILEHLKKVAKKKDVSVVIELRARFDELNNVRLAETLKAAGVKVYFGFGQLKLHAKIALVTRKVGGKEYYYTHLSTGNYNSETARQYTDLALLTSSKDFGEDARKFFNSIYREKIPSSFKVLESAPTRLHQRILRLIQKETEAAKEGKKARIVAKVNSLVDESVIEKMYAASCAGVQIDLIVRGACSLIPGVKDLSENIRVISIVDRFLEHSRIYYFEDSQKIYLSSADWMPRNFFSRLELAFPILDQRIFAFLRDTLLEMYLTDSERARELTPQGHWKRRTRRLVGKTVRAQVKFGLLAQNHYKSTALYARSLK